jgi:hypothetical protein
MNPMALLFALLTTAGAASVLGGGRRRGAKDDDDRDSDGGAIDSSGREGTGDGATDPVWGPVMLPTPPVQTGGTGTDGGSVAPTALRDETLSVMTGRVRTLTPQDDDVASVRILAQPDHGHVSVNPDNTLALVLTETRETGAMSFSYEVTHSDGSTTTREASLDVTPGLQAEGWGTGENHYMLEVDENDRVVVEHGETHRSVYISGSEKALSLADIAAREGLSVDRITGSWLAARPEYGSTEGMALAPDAGLRLWATVAPA